MRRNLVDERQPFGRKVDTTMLPSNVTSPSGGENRPGSKNINGNNGVTVVESFADKNPMAYEQACRGRDNPFGPIGKSFGVGIRNQAEVYTNAN